MARNAADRAGPTRPIDYDAFLSYSRADRPFAMALERSLRRFATPWYRSRTLRVFRDESTLTLSKSLWDSVLAGLQNARWFILLATPESAQRPWVDQEVRWWLDHHGTDRMVIALLRGEMHWSQDPRGSGSLVSDAIPDVLRDAFQAEPVWVDLSSAASSRDLSRKNPLAYSSVATVSASLRGIPKDELIGDDIRQRVRAMRILRAGIALVTALAIAAGIAAVVAVQQRDLAADRQRAATVLALTGQADALLDTKPEVAGLLAAEAYRLDPSPASRGALLRATYGIPELTWVQDVGQPIAGWAVSEDGSTAGVGTEDGSITVWSQDGTAIALPRWSTRVADLTLSRNGQFLVATDRKAAVCAYRIAGAATIGCWGTAGAEVTASAINDSGDLTILSVDDVPTTFDPRTGTVQARGPETGYPGEFRFDADTVTYAAYDGTAMRFDLATLELRQTWDVPHTPAGNYIPALSPDLHHFAVAKDDFVVVSPVADQPKPDHPSAGLEYGIGTHASSDAVAIAAGGQRAAVASTGEIYVLDALGATADSPRPRTALRGLDRVVDLSFAGDPGHLVAISRTRVVRFTLGEPGRGADTLDNEVHDRGNAVVGSFLDLSPDGQAGVWSDADGVVLATDPTHQPVLADLTTGGVRVAVNASGTAVASMDSSGSLAVHSAGTTTKLEKRQSGDPLWTDITFVAGSAEASAPPQSRVAAVHETGLLRIWTLSETDPATDAITAEQLQLDVARYQFAVDFSGDGSRLFVSDCEGLSVVDLAGAADPIERTLTSGGLCPDTGGTIAAFDSGAAVLRDGTMTVYDATGAVTQTFTASGESLAAAGDGSILAVKDSRGVIALYDIQAAQLLATLAVPLPAIRSAGSPGQVTDFGLTGDGSFMLTSTMGGAAIRWALDPEALVHAVCALAGRDLTSAEWLRYTGSEPPASIACERPIIG